MKKELTASISVIIGDTVKPFEELTEEEELLLHKNIEKRLTESMSLYYTQNPEAYRKMTIGKIIE